MKSIYEEDLIIIRMFPGEAITDKLVEACREHNVNTAVVLSSIGQLKDIELGYFVERGDYSPETFTDTYELLSLSGIITEQDGEYLPHIHAVLGSSEKKAIGGHLIRGTVQVTNETVLLTRDIKVNRTYNEKTGLKDLTPSL